MDDPETGILTVYNEATSNCSGDTQPITPTMAFNFDEGSADFGITETSVEGGPLDPTIYGDAVQDYFKDPIAVPRYNGYNRAVLIKKF
jgi:hypothetical protein